MLDTGLCMTVKNEAANIVECLSPIVDLFAEVVIIDTGSTDRTRELLQDHFGIRAIDAELCCQECYSLATQRNRGFDLLSTPWVMTLDADERIARQDLQAVMALPDSDLPAGLFCAWDTEMGAGDVVEDYKLALFRRGHYHRGLIHDTAQPSLREAGATASWAAQLRIRHVPDLHRQADKDSWNTQRLACAQVRDPQWLRYHWFSGYMLYRHGRLAEAGQLLQQVHSQRPPRFPVESLNASMVLAAIHARSDRTGAVEGVLEDAWRYYQQVRDDFEVRVNFRLGAWLEQAADLAASCNHAAIEPYAFPY